MQDIKLPTCILIDKCALLPKIKEKAERITDIICKDYAKNLLKFKKYPLFESQSQTYCSHVQSLFAEYFPVDYLMIQQDSRNTWCLYLNGNTIRRGNMSGF